jgi:hypothetical protein
MDPALAPEVTHAGCSATSFFDEEGWPDPFNDQLKQQVIQLVLGAENNSERSLQREIGPSEIGEVCDRRLAYRLAEMPKINVAFDPWPAVVGTAVHAWMEQAVQRWVKVTGDPWLTEETLSIDSFVTGHSDAYWNGTVIDWKTGGPDVMKKVRGGNIPERYQIQAHIYGLGYENLGHAVERVALVFLPRSGWLRDLVVWSAPYSRELAEAALARPYQIGQVILDLDTLTYPHRWEQIPATPGDGCGHCPWFNSIRTKEEGASDKGCPAA